MATQKKATKKTTKKAIQDLQTTKAFCKAADNWKGTVTDLNDKYIMDPLESGKKFAGDLKDDPRKVVSDLVKDSTNFVKDLGKQPRNMFEELLDEGKELLGDLKGDTTVLYDCYVDGGKKIYKAMEKDTKKIADALTDQCKKMVDKLPIKETIEGKINTFLEAVPNQLNLPDKGDIEKFNTIMKSLEKRLNAMEKVEAA